MKTITLKTTPTSLSMEIDRNKFALALKTWRIRKGLTQKQVAEKFGVSRFTIIRVENGKPTCWEIAYKIFAALADELESEKRS